MVLTFAKLGAGLLALLLLLLMVVKPLLRSLSSVAKAIVEPPMVLPAPGAVAGAGAGEGPAAAGARPSASMAYEQQIAQARSLVAKDPARVAQVVKDWVQKDE